MRFLLLLALSACSTEIDCFEFDNMKHPVDAFSITTYNVRGLPWVDIDCSKIRDALDKSDIVLMQELFTSYSRMGCVMGHEFRSQMKDNSWIGDGLARYSRVPFKHYQRAEWNRCNGYLTDNSDCIAPKGYSSAIHHIGKLDVLIYNLHMDAGKGADDIRVRKEQLIQLMYELIRTPENIPIIIAGDFNYRTTVEPDEQTDLLKWIGFRDVCDSIGMCNNQSIDRIFYRGSTESILIPTWWSENKISYSDHYPIEVNFAWRGR